VQHLKNGDFLSTGTYEVIRTFFILRQIVFLEKQMLLKENNMTAITLKSKNKADLKPFVSMAKRFGIMVEYENMQKTNSAIFKDFAAKIENDSQKTGFANEQDTINYCKEIRTEAWKNKWKK
jgi:hypothetical protein